MIEKYLERFENVLVNSGYVWEVRLLTFYFYNLCIFMLSK